MLNPKSTVPPRSQSFWITYETTQPLTGVTVGMFVGIMAGIKVGSVLVNVTMGGRVVAGLFFAKNKPSTLLFTPPPLFLNNSPLLQQEEVCYSLDRNQKIRSLILTSPITTPC